LLAPSDERGWEEVVTDADVQELIEALRVAQTQWVNGEVNPLFDLSEGTIFGPFGGPGMGGPEFGERQAAGASRFHEGTSELEVVNTIVCGEDVVCVVLVEWNMTRFDEDTLPRPWILRSTMLFRRDANKWTMLHRHADPLIDQRDLPNTLALLPERDRSRN
jgi:ketosteroid isomerase-like protein